MSLIGAAALHSVRVEELWLYRVLFHVELLSTSDRRRPLANVHFGYGRMSMTIGSTGNSRGPRRWPTATTEHIVHDVGVSGLTQLNSTWISPS